MDYAVRAVRRTEKRERSNERFRAILDSIDDGILIISVDGRAILDANQRACERFGYARAELLDLDLDRLSADVTAPASVHRAALVARARTGEVVTFEWQVRAKNGHRSWLEAATRRALFERRDVLLLTLHDISERRNAHDALTYRDRILAAVTLGLAELVQDPASPATMQRVLQAIGTSLDIERILVTEGLFPDALVASATSFVWQRDNLPRVETGSSIRTDERLGFSAWFAPMLEGEAVVAYEDTATGFVSRVLRQMGAQSVLFVPIRVDGLYWGNIIVETCKVLRRWTPVETTAMGTFAKVIGAVMSQRKAQLELAKSEAQFRAVGDVMFDALIMSDTDQRINYWNPAAERILGYSSAEALGKIFNEWLVPRRLNQDSSRFIGSLLATDAGSTGGRTVERIFTRKDGVEIAVELSISVMGGAERRVVGILRDITGRKQASELIERMASHDSLTGLPNRRLFTELLEQAIGRAKRSGRSIAVLYLDLDRFKDVNDTLGHPAGDELLKCVADRIRANMREVDTVSRFGGDEFVAMAVDIREPADAAILSDNIMKAIAAPFFVAQQEIRAAASIGIAVYGPESPSAESLLSHADVALYRAKTDGRGTYRFYTDAMDTEIRARIALEKDLSAGVALGQFFLVYQPQVDVATGRIAGLEALVRWNHPIRGLLGPEAFIVAAEKSGAMVPLGSFVIREACAQMKRWLDAGVAPPLISVNVSGVQFKAPHSLEDEIRGILAEFGVAPNLIELELTESVLMTVSQEHNAVLVRLRELGLRIAIDDFGTGYSSLDYLRRFRVDRIKIPGSFIADICTDDGAASIVRASLALADELGIDVVVEGVETAGQLALLKTWGCRNVQGYYYSKPLSTLDTATLLGVGRLSHDDPPAKLCDC